MQKKNAKVRSVIKLGVFSISCLADRDLINKTLMRQEQETNVVLHTFAFLRAPDFFKLCSGAFGSVDVVNS